MATTVHLSAHSWASAHRVLLTVVALALTLAVTLTIALVVSQTTTDETLAPGRSLNLNRSEPGFPQERCIGRTCAK